MSAIVSLTAISHRVAALPEVLRSLTTQSAPASRIILWISREKYLLDDGVRREDLPADVLQLASDARNRIEIRETENIGPHRKLLPTLAAVGNAADAPLIVTADDDTLYPHRWLEALLTAYETHGCAIGFRARRIPAAARGMVPYADWPRIPPYDEVFGYRLLATGNQGLLVHPRLLHPAIMERAFRKLCPSRADAWIAGALFGAGTPLMKLSVARVFPDEHGLQPTATGGFPLARAVRASRQPTVDTLHRFNVRVNDVALARTFEFFREKSFAAQP